MKKLASILLLFLGFLNLKAQSNLDQWKYAINNGDKEALKELYRSDAIKISSEQILEGASAIAQDWGETTDNILFVRSLYSVEANAQRGIEYEIAEYQTANGKKYNQLIIWQKESGKKYRQLVVEIENKGDYSPSHAKEIDERRLQWIELCNQHSARNLIEALYSPKTLYYNHKPLVRGQNDLIPEYGYMNNERYSLRLNPLYVLYPNSEFTLEIGQCEGSYNGKYILLWKKEEGIWRILMDSNV